MTILNASQNEMAAVALRKLVYQEFELLEAAREELDRSPGRVAELLHLEGTVQRHIFELDNALLEHGAQAAAYTGCVRHALLSTGNLRQVFARTLDRYREAVKRRSLLADIVPLLVEHLEELLSVHDRLNVGISSWQYHAS
jgi:hypothetical protein